MFLRRRVGKLTIIYLWIGSYSRWPLTSIFPCPFFVSTTFSRASIGRHRNEKNLGGHSPEAAAAAANEMIEDLIVVLKYYKRLNPRCLIVIENPVGYLQKMEYNEIFEKEGGDELQLKRVTVSYCMLAEENILKFEAC